MDNPLENFDITIYREFNKDLKDFNDEELITHFLK
jgi:hypothetical protein